MTRVAGLDTRQLGELKAWLEPFFGSSRGNRGHGGDGGGRVAVSILVTDPAGAAITVGDGKAYFRVPSILTGTRLVAVAAHLITASSSGIPTVQLHNDTTSHDLLTTSLTIDANEIDSSTAATPAVIDTTVNTVHTADELRVDIDVAGTGAKGLIVEMQFG